jgi:HAMP domain-containing protein
VLLGTLFAGEISRPVRKLAEGARRLAGGDYATRVSVRSHNEVGVLADAFNVMGEEIQKAIEEVKRRAEENEELFMGSIRMLANAIDEKDPYTRGHSSASRTTRPAAPSTSGWTARTSGACTCRASSTTSARSGSRTRSCARRRRSPTTSTR